ncbi:MAG: PAS domain S-box protein [Deltaproteobacteria bacterium]|nr:PAS domain S-box protein [Deltaproteobacteria bacterium]
MKKQLKKLILYRFILITITLFMGLLFQLRGISAFWGPYAFFYFFIFLIYATTIIFTFLIQKAKNFTFLIHAQTAADALIITGIIYISGGSDSVFTPLYILAILEAGVMLERRGGLMAASVCSISYGLLLTLEYHWVIPSLIIRLPYHNVDLLTKVSAYILAFFGSGYLTGYLAEEVQKRGKELIKSKEDFSRLEAFNRDVIQSIQSGLLTVNLKDRVTFLNKAGQEILGITISQCKNRPISDLFSTLNNNFHEGLRSRMETTFQKPDGEETKLGLSISPLKDHRGNKVGQIIIFQDLTHIKEMEESMRRSEKLATIGQLAAGIAHEIRNPLASISGAIQLLKEEQEGGESDQRLMEIILAESGRLNRLITDFLLYAQPPKLNKKKVDVGALVENTLEVFTRSPQWTKGMKLAKIVDANATIAADPQQLEQVLWNLFINAVDAMEGKGMLEIKVNRDGTGKTVTLLVADTGKGISPKHIDRIFDPFFTTKEGGSGLGLSIVHKIVENHEGDISVESRSDRGTTFTLTFPAT